MPHTWPPSIVYCVRCTCIHIRTVRRDETGVLSLPMTLYYVSSERILPPLQCARGVVRPVLSIRPPKKDHLPSRRPCPMRLLSTMLTKVFLGGSVLVWQGRRRRLPTAVEKNPVLLVRARSQDLFSSVNPCWYRWYVTCISVGLVGMDCRIAIQ